MSRYIKILSAFLAGLLVACSGAQSPKKAPQRILYEVKPLPLHKTLHFTGIIQPLREESLTSPMEAVVASMDAHYGQRVKKGDILLNLNAPQLQKLYNETLTDYLKAKDNYAIAKAKFVGTEDLWQAGLISKNNYVSEKSGVDTAHMSLMQSTRKLTEMIEKLDDSQVQDLAHLRLSDFDEVRKLLSAHHERIQLRAPSDGILLYPPKAEDQISRVTVGSAVKSGQVIALVGDLSGISVEIDVPEIDIDKIRPGMQAIISGVAFGRHQLQGKLLAVNAQASSSGGGLPSFSALVEVSALTSEEREWIKVGMSADIELMVESKDQLWVPIAAIKREKGENVVTLQLARGGIEKRVVRTGPAQANSVVVESGLKAGDLVIYSG